MASPGKSVAQVHMSFDELPPPSPSSPSLPPAGAAAKKVRRTSRSSISGASGAAAASSQGTFPQLARTPVDSAQLSRLPSEAVVDQMRPNKAGLPMAAVPAIEYEKEKEKRKKKKKERT